MSQDNVEMIRKGIDDFNRRDFDAALATTADEITWEPFLSRTETPLLRGKEQIRAAWEGQAEMMGLRIEPEEFIAVGAMVVVPMRLIAQGHGSGMSLDASVTWVFTIADGLTRSVERFDSRDEALKAVGLEE